MTQPPQQPPGQPPYGQPPYGQPLPAGGIPNYLVPSILVTIFCCLPAGVVAIVFAAQVNSKVSAGDIAGAQQASKNAKTWTIVSLVLGLVAAIIWGIIVATTGTFTFTTS
jgi:hypothetical protein